MTSPSTPPALAERILSWLIRDRDWRDSIVGDLREEFAESSRRDGLRRARRWYWREALTIGMRALITRGAARRARTRWPLDAAEIESSRSWRAGFARDLRHAVRAVARRPATSLVVVASLALTLAANSSIFALVDALVLRPFRFPGVERLVVIVSSNPQDAFVDRESVAPADFREWRSESHTLTNLSAAEWWDANLSGTDKPEQVAGFRVTADFFKAFQIQPMLGRDFVRGEETPGQHRRAILGYRLWIRQFGGNPGVVGQAVHIDGEPYEVVGIAPKGFAIPDGAEIWAPLAYSPDEWNNRRRGFLVVSGRLQNGVSLDRARAEIESIVARQRREYPDTNQARMVAVLDFQRGMADPGAGPFMSVVQAAGVLLLLIACANIANLLLARGGERAQEYAVRLALGAGRGRLAGQTILEGSILAVIAVIISVPLAWAALDVSRASIPASVIRFVPGLDFMRISPELFLVMLAMAAGATLAFTLFPALQAARIGISLALGQNSRTLTSSRERHWLRSTLAASQMALTLALLFGSVLLTATAYRAINGMFGFDKHNLLVARVVLPERPYAEADRRRQFVTTVTDRMRAIPAVSAVAMVSNLPYSGGNATRGFWPEGVTVKDREVRQVDYRRVSLDYFDTMRIPLLAGRDFSNGDRAGTEAVAIVSRSLAERYWPGASPLGRRFRITADGEWTTIVGVVGDVLHDWFQQRRAPTVYRPLAQDAPLSVAFVARTVGDPSNVAGDLRRAAAAADPDQPVIELKSMEDVIQDRTAGIAFIARALRVVGLIAFVLAITGLYSLMAFMTSRRTQEIGVRMALGATWWQVMRLATAQAVRITIAGLVVGAVMSAVLGRVLESVLLGGVSNNLSQLGMLTGLMATVALTAAYLAARRAASIDPTLALRAE